MCTCTSEKGKIHFQITSFREKSYLIIQFDLIKYILNKRKNERKICFMVFFVVVAASFSNVSVAIPRSTQKHKEEYFNI